MMRGARNLLWLVPLATLLTVPLWLAPAGRFLAPRSEAGGGKGVPPLRPRSFVMDDVRLTQHQEGVVKWKIRSRQVSSADSGETLLLDGVEADLFRDRGILFHIVGSRGRYEQKQKKLGLAGDVTVKHRNGAVVQTEQLTFLDAVDRFETDAPVRMASDGMEIRGQGLEYDLKGRWYSVAGRVNVDVR